jgi:hypothetical protein
MHVGLLFLIDQSFVAGDLAKSSDCWMHLEEENETEDSTRQAS